MNAELIAELRGHILSVPLTLLRDAADALEAAEKRIEELERSFSDVCNANGSLACERNELLNDVRELEAQLPKEGEWIEDEYGYIHCSKCGMEWDEPEHPQTNYCPNCGAKMRTVTDCHTLNER